MEVFKKLKLLILSLSLLIVTAVFTPCFAAVEWSVQNRLQMESSPVDVAVSLNDKWVFVLNDWGEVFVVGSRFKIINLPLRQRSQHGRWKPGKVLGIPRSAFQGF